MNMPDAMIIFDLDGTLWDSAENVAVSWNEVIKKTFPERANLTAADIQAVMGKTMDEIAKALMPDKEQSIRKKIFDECYAHENEYIKIHGGRLFKGVRQTLDELLSKGFKMAIVSNCQAGYINAFLVSMDMGKYFCDTEEWGRSGLLKAENIRLVMERNGFKKAVYIGDTAGDEAASKKADVPFIYAAYGFGSADAPYGEIKEFSDLPAELERVLNFKG